MVFTLYKVAISELHLVQISGLWGHLGTIKHTLLFQLQRCSLLESLLQNCCTRNYRSTTISFHNLHTARVINTRAD